MAHPEFIDDKPQGSGMAKKSKGENGDEIRGDESDRLSDLPDIVLLHIMNLMDTKDAVRTCVLSKRWKNLCKRLTNLTFIPKINWELNFEKFVLWVLNTKDDSYSLLNLSIHCLDYHPLIDCIIIYALRHNVQQMNLQLETILKLLKYVPKFMSIPYILRCEALTSLKLCGGDYSDIILPKSLHLPAIRSLHLGSVKFSLSNNGCVEPFSNFLGLNTLILDHCSIHNVNIDERVLVISNPTLSDLRIDPGGYVEIVLSTPNLKTLTVNGFLFSELSTTCNLACLEEVKVDLSCFHNPDLILIAWLKVLVNVKILTFSSYCLRSLRYDLYDPTSKYARLPCFVRLEAIKVNKRGENLSKKIVKKAVKYLLQNSPKTTVDVIISD